MIEPRCHHHIGPPHHERERDGLGKYARVGPLWQYCSLPAIAWCARCSIFVCSHHGAAKHAKHDTEQIVLIV